MTKSKKLKAIWVICMNGCDGEFMTQDLRPAWSSQTAAKNALVSAKGSNGADKDYRIVKFLREVKK